MAYMESFVTIAYSEPCNIQNPGIFRILIYSELPQGIFWHIQNAVFLIGIHYMQDGAVTMRHGVIRKRNTKRLKHTGNLFRKNLQLKGIC